MTRFIYTLLIALFLCASYHQVAYSVCPPPVGNTITCTDAPPNPDLGGIQEQGNDNNLTINMLSGSAIDTSIANGGNVMEGIGTGNGNNVITTNNSSILGELNAIETEAGNDEVNVIDSQVSNLETNTIDLGPGYNTLNITRSTVMSVNDRVLSFSGGDDVVNIVDSEVKISTANGNDEALFTSGGNDTVFIENSIVRGEFSGASPDTVDLGSGNDILTLGTGAILLLITPGNVEEPGEIDCGSDFDTIIFAMAVPTNQIAAISAEIASKDPAGDEIRINGLTYIWEDFEQLTPQLVGGFESSVPTLSEWGLIAMAGVLGLVGFMVVRRRAITA